MKILVTGAHFTPAVAVIEQMKKYPDVKIVYVGRKTTLEGDKSQSQESQVLPKLGVKFIHIITGRLQREFTFYTIPSLFKIPIGLLQSFWIILFEKPNVVLSFGGYVAVPIVLVSWFFSIPILIHEQTLASGLANKISSFFADKIALSFRDPKKAEKIILTGNPLRKEILSPIKNLPVEYVRLFSNSKKEKLPTILIMGGSQGSHIINKTVKEVLDKFTKLACIIHVTGDNKFGDFERLERLQNDKYLVKKWIGEEIGAIYSKIDLVISRAGANTLTELAYFGKPVLVIPFEPLYQDEQNKNAKYFETLGLVQILPQFKLSGNTLLKNLKSLLNDLNHLTRNAEEAKRVLITDAAKRLALETVLLGEKYEKKKI